MPRHVSTAFQPICETSLDAVNYRLDGLTDGSHRRGTRDGVVKGREKLVWSCFGLSVPLMDVFAAQTAIRC